MPADVPPGVLPGAAQQLALPFEPEPHYTQADYIAAASNEAARTWIDREGEWPDRRLLLYGDAGSGKTHLLHRWRERRGAILLSGPHLAWPTELPLSGRIGIDIADAAPEEPLLHLLNAAHEAGGLVVLASRPPPALWPVTLPDLASRLRAMPLAAIERPEEALLRQLLGHLLAQRQLVVPEAVQDWLLLQLPRTPAALHEAAARLDRAALAAGRRVTRQLAAAIVDELAPMWQPYDGSMY